jgi:hypothetical protein
MGDKVILIWNNGSREIFLVHFRQKDGMITELMGEQNQVLIAPGLCEENLYR